MDRTAHGIALTAAYHKVHYVSGNKDNMHITVRVYVDAAAAAATPEDPVEELGYTMDVGDLDFAATTPWGGNNIKQAYDHIAGLAEYSSAVSA